MNASMMKGKVYFMGAGSGEAELQSPEAVRLLRAAEVVLHDAEVPQAVLDLTPPWTQVRNVGSAEAPGLPKDKVHALLITAALEGHQVVRLKAGEQPVAASAGDELEALEQAGVEYELIFSPKSAMGATAGTRSH
jgi:siroheme synthase